MVVSGTFVCMRVASLTPHGFGLFRSENQSFHSVSIQISVKFTVWHADSKDSAAVYNTSVTQ